MKDHYFSEKPESSSTPRTIQLIFRGKSFEFQSDEGVFSKDHLDHGSRTLLEAALDQPGGELLDLGCGYGAIGILFALHQKADITMVEINSRAAELAKYNAKKHKVEAEVFHQDGIEGLGYFDTILFNPPIRTGKQNVYRLFDEALQHLKKDGRMLVVMRKKQGLDSAKKFFQEKNKKIRILKKSAGFHVMEIREQG